MGASEPVTRGVSTSLTGRGDTQKVCRVNLPLVIAAALHALVAHEDVTFAQWRQSLGREPSPAELVGAIELLSAKQRIAPGGRVSLADDPELRRRALRNPWSRGPA